MGWEALEDEILLSSQLSAETAEAAEDFRADTVTSSSVENIVAKKAHEALLQESNDEAWWSKALKQHTKDMPMSQRRMAVSLVSACSGMLTEAHVLKDQCQIKFLVHQCYCELLELKVSIHWL